MKLGEAMWCQQHNPDIGNDIKEKSWSQLKIQVSSAETYLEPSRTYTMELFCENS